MTKIFITAITLIGLLAGLSACGRRAALEAPSAGGDQTETTQAGPKQDKPFILDSLID